MKVKKEPIILAVIIAALIIYLVIRNNDRTNYELPDIVDVPAALISGIEISGPQGPISLKKTDETWYIEPQGYPADGMKVQEMLEVIERPVLTDLASESKNYGRYGLEKDKKITVKALSNDAPAREFEIGYTTADKRQTFIRLGEDYRVYHCLNNIRGLFEKKSDELRDKEVLSFNENEITGISIQKGAQLVELSLKKPPVKEDSESEANGSEPEGLWQRPDGTNADIASVEVLLDKLSRLLCREYIYDVAKETPDDPVCIVRLKGEKEYVLSIFSRKEGDNEIYPGLSSENEYPFILKSSDAKNILDSSDGLIAKGEGQ